MKQNVKIIKQTIITEFEDGSVVKQVATGNGVSSTITQTNDSIKINVNNETFDAEKSLEKMIKNFELEFEQGLGSMREKIYVSEEIRKLIELYERVKSPISGYYNKPTNWKVAPNINQKS